MTATNHALTGAVIGMTVSNPVFAVMLAFLSHFALDALPHYGPKKGDIGGNRFRNYLLLDISLCIVLVLILAFTSPQHWFLAAVCAFFATSPDAMWLPDFVRARRGQKQRTFSGRGPLVRLHAWVQWYQKPLGAITEALWLVVAGGTLTWLMR